MLSVGRGGILWNATDYASEEGETFVFRATPDGKPPELLATIKIGEWDQLARGNLRCAPRAHWSGKGEPPVD